MASTDTAVTNAEVIRVYQEKGTNGAVQYVFGLINDDPKPTKSQVSNSVTRLAQRHDRLRKDRCTEQKKGIAGQEGTYDYWMNVPYKFPVVSEPKVSPNSVLNEIRTSAPITRNEAPFLREQLEQERSAHSLSRDETTVLSMKLKSKTAELKRVRSRESFHRGKAAKFEQQAHQQSLCESDVATNTNSEAFDRLKEENISLQEELKSLEDELSNLKNETVTCYDSEKNCFKSEFRMLVYTLLQEHVGLDHINPVINAVLGYVNKTTDRLPCEKTIRTMNIERLHLSQTQLAEDLVEKKNTTLYSDETSKHGEKYMGFHASDTEKRFYVLGLRDLATKSAEDTFNSFKTVLEDIEKTQKNTKNETAKKLLANITNTMSDRAATELKWHHMLENYRKNILPDVQKNWDTLTEEEREPIEKLRSFFCGLHTYVQAAEVSGAALMEIEPEKKSTGPQIVKTNEPGTVRLIRTAAKAFARGGDEKNGCYGEFRNFGPLKQKVSESGLTSIPIVPFRGNRFNIIFFNGGFVYFLHKEIITFLEGQPQLNRLLRAVLEDIKEPLYIGGCKALGLMSKLLLGPLWRVIENNEVGILEMGPFIRDVLDKLESACKDLEPFIKGECVLSDRDEWRVKKDSVFEFLTSPNESVDSEVETCLKVMLPAVCKLLRVHYKDLLEKDETENEKAYTESVVKHNKFAERVFAYTDQLLRFKPNITHIAQEAYIMFCLNETGKWLQQKDTEERIEKIDNARKAAPKLQELYQERRRDIKNQRSENLLKKREEEEKRKARQMKEKEMIVNDILYYGLYQNKDQLETGINNIKSKTEKVDALKAQLRFRQQILKQHVDPVYFRFSEKKRQLSLEELKENALHLIEHARQLPQITSETSKSSTLIGKKIIHRFEDKGKMTEYHATVISTVPGYPQWFNLKYDGDQENIYVDKLEESLDNGDANVVLS